MIRIYFGENMYSAYVFFNSDVSHITKHKNVLSVIQGSCIFVVSSDEITRGQVRYLFLKIQKF